MSKWKKKVCFFIAFFLILMILPGGKAEAAAKKKANKLTFKSDYGTIVLKKGKKRTLGVRCNKKKIDGSKLAWKSSKKSVVSVKNGTLTAKNSGSAVISVKLKKGKSNTLKCKVYVYKKDAKTSFTNGRGTYVIDKGKTETLKPEKKGSYTIFVSSNNKVASVSNTGKVKGLRSGTATITCVSVGTYRYKASIKIQSGERVTGIKLDSDESEITPILGESYQIRAIVTPSTASIKTLSYVSSNPEVAVVSSTGLIQTRGEGMTTITMRATDGSKVEKKLRVYVSNSNDNFGNAGEEGVKKSQWVAHRGASKAAPENSLPAFELAGQYGFPIIECDIRETRDQALVVSHDGNLKRMCGVEKDIADMTLEEIRQYPITGGSNAEQYPDNKIIALDEFIECCNRYGSVPMIEVKSPISKTGLDNLYNKLSLSEKPPIVISFYSDILVYLREKDSNLELQKVMHKLTDSAFEKCRKYNWNVDVEYEDVTYSMVRKVQDAGLKLNVWTVNSRNIAQIFYGWKVDYISTDYKFF